MEALGKEQEGLELQLEEQESLEELPLLLVELEPELEALAV